MLCCDQDTVYFGFWFEFGTNQTTFDMVRKSNSQNNFLFFAVCYLTTTTTSPGGVIESGAVYFVGVPVHCSDAVSRNQAKDAGEHSGTPLSRSRGHSYETGEGGADGEGGSEYQPRESGRIGGEVKKPKNVGKGCVWKDIQVQNHGVLGGKRRKYNSAAKHTREVR